MWDVLWLVGGCSSTCVAEIHGNSGRFGHLGPYQLINCLSADEGLHD